MPRGGAIFCLALALAAAAGGAARGQTDSCDRDPSPFLPAAFNASGAACIPIWNNFILRYSQNDDNVLSIILSDVSTDGWVGMGFSKDGMMVGSSAMVGWIDDGGRATIKQYYLGGQSSSQVVANDGNLLVTNVSPSVVIYGSNIYLAFQLQMSSRIKQQYLIFAFSTTAPTTNQLSQHNDRASLSFDFTSGTSSAFSYPNQLKRNHGALNILGWGVLLPIGAMIARYCREWDPLWYYLHVVIQFSGFILGLAGVVAGISLYGKLHSNVSAHRGLGIFVFVLGILQVAAFFLRPDKDSKFRGYWNWYHHWAGRLALFLASANIIYGIHVGDAGSSWKVGYSVVLSVLLIAIAVLEISSRNRRSRKSAATAAAAPPPSAFQMQPMY